MARKRNEDGEIEDKFAKWNVLAPPNVSSQPRHGEALQKKNSALFPCSKKILRVLTSTSSSKKEHLRGWNILKDGGARSISGSGARKD